MSSMRNAVQRRNHKERAQPREREKWGILEKHKDYSLRAKDYNEKKARLKLLRQKAADRNPDEFYYGMLSSQSDRGRKLTDRGNKSLSQEAVKLLKTQDAAYLQNAIRRNTRAMDKLGQEFLLKDGRGIEILGQEASENSSNHHIVFAQDAFEQKNIMSRIDKRMPDTHVAETDLSAVESGQPGFQGTPMPKPRRQHKREEFAAREARIEQKKHKKEQNATRAKAVTLKTREKDLRDAERELDLQRAKMNCSIGGVNKDGKKWHMRQRKR